MVGIVCPQRLHLQPGEIDFVAFVLRKELFHRQTRAAVAGFAAEDRGQRAVDGPANGRVVVPSLDDVLVESGDVPLAPSSYRLTTSAAPWASAHRECKTCPNN